MTSTFDPSVFDQPLEANATRRDPLPVGDAIFQVTAMNFKDGVAGPSAKNPGAPWHRVDFVLETTDSAYLAGYGDGTVPKATLTYGIMLDMNGVNIAVGPNKNTVLGRFREACGQNGKPLSACLGQFIRAQVGQKANPKDPEAILNEVTAVAKV